MSLTRQSLRVEVLDAGVGVSPESRSSLFGFLGNHFTQTQIGGSGLGLYTLASRISALGGKYGYYPNHFSDREEKGSVFWFEIPYEKDLLLSSDLNSVESSLLSSTPDVASKFKDLIHPINRNRISASSSTSTHKLEIRAVPEALEPQNRPVGNNCSHSYAPIKDRDHLELVEVNTGNFSLAHCGQALKTVRTNNQGSLSPRQQSNAPVNTTDVVFSSEIKIDNVEKNDVFHKCEDNQTTAANTEVTSSENNTADIAESNPSRCAALDSLPSIDINLSVIVSNSEENSSPKMHDRVDADVAVKLDSPSSKRRGLSNLNILVVDDSLPIRKMCAMILKQRGHVVETASNGKEALLKMMTSVLSRQRSMLCNKRAQSKENIENSPDCPLSKLLSFDNIMIDAQNATTYDLVLMDIQMPVMDGIEAVTKFRVFEDDLLSKLSDLANFRAMSGISDCGMNMKTPTPEMLSYHLPVIAMSASSDSSIISQAIVAGMSHFIAKPFQMQILDSVIAEVVV